MGDVIDGIQGVEGGGVVLKRGIVDVQLRVQGMDCPAGGIGFDFDIFTFGADGVSGGDGVNADIGTWTEG